MKHILLTIPLICTMLVHAPRITHAAMQENMFSFSLGHYDLIDQENQAVDIRGELRFKQQVLGFLHPCVGLEFTSDRALYGAAGMLADISLGEKWHVIPSLGAGLYADGNGKQLGHTIQFRSQLELSYEFENKHRFGVSFSHLSNCHLDDDNPGSEVLALTYSIPLPYDAPK